MQPNDQQGYYQPEQTPSAPQAGPAPAPQPQSAPSLQPLGQQPSTALDPAEVQAALNEPAPVAPQQQLIQPADQQAAELDRQDDAPVTWVAHEYIHQEKGTMWFTIFGIVLAVFIAAAIFLMQSITFAILLVVIAIVVVVYSKRPPRELTYSLTDEGLVVDEKLHKFSDFKSFGVIRDGEEYSVMLIPTQRFQPGVTVYFPEEAGEDIVDILGSRLPMKDLKLDAVDRVVRLLRL